MQATFANTRLSPSPVCVVALIFLVLTLACSTSEAPEEPGSSPDSPATPVGRFPNEDPSGGPAPGAGSSRVDATTSSESRAGESPTGTPPGSSSSASPPPASGAADQTALDSPSQTIAMPSAIPIPTRTIPVEEVTWSLQGVFPLHQAAFDGTLAEVEALLAQGEPVGARAQFVSSAGETREVTPTELAVWNNSPEVVELLIENGGGHSGLAPIAAQHNPDPAVMDVLLKAFADQFQTALEGATVQRGDFAKAARAWVLPCAMATTARYPGPVDRFLASGWNAHLSDFKPIIYGRGRIAGQFCKTNPGSRHTRAQYAGFFSEVVAKNPHPEVLQVFLDHGADIDNEWEGLSYLHRAAQHNPEPAVAALLIDRGLDVNQPTARGETPLHLALGNDEPSVAAALIARGADVNGGAALHNPLWLALTRNPVDVRLIRLLLETGADPNPNVPARNTSPLIHVMRWDEPARSEVVGLLLERGAKVNARDSVRFTALHHAMGPESQAGENSQVVKLLLDAGADVNAQNHRGETPLHLALQRADVGVVQLMREAGPDVGLQHPDGGSLLHLTGRNDAEETEALVELLLDAGADPDARDQGGNTLLNLSVHNPRVVELLLDGGADADARDSNGLTALYLAVGRGGGSPETVELLLDAGADPHADHGGRTPCQRARQHQPASPGGQRLLDLACSP